MWVDPILHHMINSRCRGSWSYVGRRSDTSPNRAARALLESGGIPRTRHELNSVAPSTLQVIARHCAGLLYDCLSQFSQFN
jgi:hypothetical protein